MPTGRPQTGVGGSVWYQSAGVSVCRQNSRRSTSASASRQNSSVSRQSSRRRRRRLQVVEAELKAEGGTQRGTQTQTERRRTQTSPSQGGTQTNVRRLKTERDAVSRRNADERKLKTMTFPKTEGRFQNQRSADRSPTEDEASRERETDRRSRKISASEVGQQGGVARHCSKAASQGQTMPGRASQGKKILASQVSFAERRRSRATQGSGDVAGSGDAREGVARQLSPLQNPL